MPSIVTKPNGPTFAKADDRFQQPNTGTSHNPFLSPGFYDPIKPPGSSQSWDVDLLPGFQPPSHLNHSILKQIPTPLAPKGKMSLNLNTPVGSPLGSQQNQKQQSGAQAYSARNAKTSFGQSPSIGAPSSAGGAGAGGIGIGVGTTTTVTSGPLEGSSLQDFGLTMNVRTDLFDTKNNSGGSNSKNNHNHNHNHNKAPVYLRGADITPRQNNASRLRIEAAHGSLAPIRMNYGGYQNQQSNGNVSTTTNINMSQSNNMGCSINGNRSQHYDQEYQQQYEYDVVSPSCVGINESCPVRPRRFNSEDWENYEEENDTHTTVVQKLLARLKSLALTYNYYAAKFPKITCLSIISFWAFLVVPLFMTAVFGFDSLVPQQVSDFIARSIETVPSEQWSQSPYLPEWFTAQHSYKHAPFRGQYLPIRSSSGTESEQQQFEDSTPGSDCQVGSLSLFGQNSSLHNESYSLCSVDNGSGGKDKAQIVESVLEDIVATTEQQASEGETDILPMDSSSDNIEQQDQNLEKASSEEQAEPTPELTSEVNEDSDANTSPEYEQLEVDDAEQDSTVASPSDINSDDHEDTMVVAEVDEAVAAHVIDTDSDVETGAVDFDKVGQHTVTDEQYQSQSLPGDSDIVESNNVNADQDTETNVAAEVDGSPPEEAGDGAEALVEGAGDSEPIADVEKGNEAVVDGSKPDPEPEAEVKPSTGSWWR